MDTVLFAIALAVAPPLAAVAYSWLVGRVSRWAGDVLYLVALAAFLVPFAFQLSSGLDPSKRQALLVVLAVCAVATVAYVRWRAVRLFLCLSVILPIGALAWFVAGIPTTIDEAEAAPVKIGSRTPVVLVVLDELPVTSLMTRDGRIDALRYPSFGQSARDATWYPNTTTVHPFTSKAVPAILTGKMPRRDSLPTLTDHPENLFTLLGGSYSLFAHEGTTRLCPINLCPRPGVSHLSSVNILFHDVGGPYILKAIPDSITGAGDFAVPADGTFARASDSAATDFEGFIEAFEARPRLQASTTRTFCCLTFPGVFSHPVASTDSLRATNQRDAYFGRPIRGSCRSPSNGISCRCSTQMHWLAALLRKYWTAGLYDRALVVVAADHGASFRMGAALRDVTTEHFAGVASIPLFVKYPGQKRGATDLRPARTVDILPTIADVLGIRMPWRVDGSSLAGPAVKREKAIMLRDEGDWVSVSQEEVKRQRENLVRWKTRLFGEGHDSLFAIGVNKRLLGARVDESWPSLRDRPGEDRERVAVGECANVVVVPTGPHCRVRRRRARDQRYGVRGRRQWPHSRVDSVCRGRVDRNASAPSFPRSRSGTGSTSSRSSQSSPVEGRFGSCASGTTAADRCYNRR